MKTRSDAYLPIPQDELNEVQTEYATPKPPWIRRIVSPIFVLILAVSLAGNVWTVASWWTHHTPIDPISEAMAAQLNPDSDVTPFGNKSSLQFPKGLDLADGRKAKLKWDKWVMYEHGGLYMNDTEAVTNAAWEAINYDTGNVALDDEYVAEMGLPVSQRFPWDDSKGLYFMNGMHQIHCLAALRHSFFQLRDDIPLSLSWEHNMHCFNALRQEILCTADDTPRSMTFAHPGSVGVGQYRRCRDWDKMVEWTRDRWSCWRDINKTDHIDTLLRYRYCPKESPYYERIHAIFGDFEMGEGASANN